MSSLYKIGESAKSFSSRTELNECEDVRKSFGCFMTQLIKKNLSKHFIETVNYSISNDLSSFS